MGEQVGIIPITGTMNNMTFYKSADGMRVKTQSKIAKDKIMTSDAFQRTRENMAEFGKAGTAGKVLRNAVRAIMLNGKDSRVVSRLHTQMMKVVKADTTSIRGQRNVLDGETELLKGFDFNSSAVLSATFHAPYLATIDRPTGALSITLPGYTPFDMLVKPQGATHYKVVSAGSEIDFENSLFNTQSFESAFLLLDNNITAALDIAHALPAHSVHPLFLLLGVQFFQEVNGQKYSLKNGAYNSLCIVEVEGV